MYDHAETAVAQAGGTGMVARWRGGGLAGPVHLAVNAAPSVPRCGLVVPFTCRTQAMPLQVVY